MPNGYDVYESAYQIVCNNQSGCQVVTMVTGQKENKGARHNLVEMARNAIERNILDGVFRPDQRLVEAELAKQLGISRTPVREALRQLETSGYVIKRDHAGYFVVYHAPEDIKNILELREVLEVAAIRMACERATQESIDRAAQYLANWDQDFASLKTSGLAQDKLYDEGWNKLFRWNNLFHQEFYNASGNKLLVANIESLRQLDRLKRISRFFRYEDLVEFRRQHYKILEAVRQRNKAKAEKAVRLHLETLFRFYRVFL